jgi:hypothetical protein
MISLLVVCMGSHIVSYARALYRSSDTHMCDSLVGNSIGAKGAQYIGAALAHNSTLQTLK